MILEKIFEMYRTESFTMFQLNVLVGIISFLVYSLIQEKNNHISRQLGKKLKASRKKNRFKLGLDLEDGIFSAFAKKIEKKMEKKLENANINFTPKEFSFMFIMGMLVGAGVGFLVLPTIFYNIFNLLTSSLSAKLLSRVFSTVFFGAIGMGTPFVLLFIKIKNRKKKLGDQLIDLVMSLADGMKSASTTQGAIRVVAQEMPSPISDELKKVVGELEYGVTFEEALENLKRRIDLSEYAMVINAMQIQSRTGTQLEFMLRSMAKVAEERREIKEDVLKIVRATKSTAYILLAAPFALGGGTFLLMPELVIPAYTSKLGFFILIGIGAIYALALFALKQIDNFVAKSL
jgi:Flp pilus assembly protein TadB